MKKIASLVIVLTQLLSVAWADSFVVRNIEVQGSEHITAATIESYMPIKRGQVLTSEKTAAVVRALYKTGFFDKISLSQSGNTLIVRVDERPTIGQLKISGNSIIPTDKLTTVMKSMDIAEGRVYNAALLERIKQSLLNQYYQLGRYNARIDVNVTPMPRDRVMVKIEISEGLVAKVRRISIMGNHVFTESKLVDQLDVTTTGLVSIVTQADRYSEEKLDASLDKLRSYYMDRGYVRFQVKSAQAEVTPDRKSVYISIVVDEGSLYTVKSIDLNGQFIVSREEIAKNISLKPGDVFSRQKIIDSEKAITKVLGEKGYMFAVISINPHVNDKTHDVILVFTVKPGKRVYVRHVTFSDNNRTNDVVLRREIQQMESAPASTTKLDDSKRRLSMLPFITDTEMAVVPVAGTDDKVDVNYKVKEDNSAQATFKLGYSQIYRAMVGVGLNQKNFLGTGNTFGINFQQSRYEQFYGVDYTNPYYTEDGISRSFNASISRVDPRGAGNNVGYTMQEYNLGVLYGIPVGDEEGVFNRVQAGASYQNMLINLTGNSSSNQVMGFVSRHGRHYQELDMKLGYSRVSLDKAIFPTRGASQSLFLDGYAPLDRNSLTFYTLNYSGKSYIPITDEYIILSRAALGYGSGLHQVRNYFPFFKNYFAGGMDTVRGYQGFQLGPQDSNGKAFGANMLINGSVGLIFPNYLSDKLRTNVFVDAGNVYSSYDNRDFGGNSTNSGPIRYSVGVEADVLTPFGPIALALSKPFLHKHDQSDAFSFALGANF